MKVATQTTVHGERKDPARKHDPNAPKIAYSYVRRTGFCPTHRAGGWETGAARTSTQFVGVNEHGWVFFCSQEGSTHYFVNRPPAHHAGRAHPDA